MRHISINHINFKLKRGCSSFLPHTTFIPTIYTLSTRIHTIQPHVSRVYIKINGNRIIKKITFSAHARLKSELCKGEVDLPLLFIVRTHNNMQHGLFHRYRGMICKLPPLIFIVIIITFMLQYIYI